MNQILSLFSNAPKPVQAGVLVASGGGIFAAASLLSFRAGAVLIAGIALVGLLLLGYRWMLKRMAARKANPMEQAIRGNAGAAPVGIAEPARRARLDDLRKNFESGVQKFREAGKNLYSLPWYMLVGEPGSGKTEAIRHCNVGFPPGLQDQLQGAGGTLNMNWWFTNHAVILDTAGRLMFEEVEPGATSEWQEFLKLLRRGRPNCPVNGLLLVIPSESLIKDTAEAIEKKGGKIAQQLDNIQRVLGVRFPVYVVVTKCDLINGFREFFDSINDPGLQHQIMGWSNPAPLDTPFNPEHVDQHLRTVKERLARRRLGLLQDPVNTEDARARRTDQVDALYEFPEAFMDIAPRLQRYLQMIFVAGEWSAKPLFLRGIYFTSSMREGEALDAKLAEALGVNVESLPEGKVWDRERAYFLRDLFMAKVFREKGLVTRANNTSAQQRARRNLLYGVSGVGLALLIGFSVLGLMALKKTIVEPARFWSKLGEEMREPNVMAAPGRTHDLDPKRTFSAWAFPLVTYAQTFEVFGYRGENQIKGVPIAGPQNRTWAGLSTALKDESQRAIDVPWVYRPVAVLTGDTGSLAAGPRRDAARSVFAASVLRPLLEATRAQLATDAAATTVVSGDEQTIEALAQLLRLEVGALMGPVGAAKPVEVAPLLRYLLTRPNVDEAARKQAEADAIGIQQALVDLYTGSDKSAWPPPVESVGGATGAELTDWITLFDKRAGDGDPNSAYGKARALVAALKRFQTAEVALHDLGRAGGAPAAMPWQEWVGQWSTRYRDLSEAKAHLESLAPILGGRPLREVYDRALADHLSSQVKRVNTLLAEIEPLTGTDTAAAPALDTGNPRRAVITAIGARLNGVRTALATPSAKQAAEQAELAALDAAMLAGDGWQRRFTMYAAADQAQDADKDRLAADPMNPGDIGDRLIALSPRAQQLIQGLPLAPAAADKPVQAFWTDGITVSTRAIRVGATRAATELVKRLIEGRPGAADAIGDRVEELARQPDFRPPARPALMLTAPDGGFDPAYAPAPAVALLKDYLAASAVVAKGSSTIALERDREALAQQAARHIAAGHEYFASFVRAWTVGLADSAGPLAARATRWAEFAEQINARPGEPWKALEEVAAIQDKIGKDLQPLQASLDEASRRTLDDFLAAIADARATLRAGNATRKGLNAIIENWRALGADAALAGSTLVSRMSLANNIDDFYAESDDDDPNFVTGYVHSLSVAGFKTIANTGAGGMAQALARAKELHRPPLAPWRGGGGGGGGGGDQELTPDEVAEARQRVAQLPAAVDAGSGGGVLCTKLLPAKVQADIRALAGCGIVQAVDMTMIDDIRRRLALIPADPRRATATISYVKDNREPPPGVVAFGDRGSIRLSLGAAPGRVVQPPAIAPGAAAAFDPIPLYHADAVTLEFFNDADGRVPLEKYTFPTRWLPLYLLHSADGATSRTADATLRITTERQETLMGTVRVELPAGADRPR